MLGWRLRARSTRLWKRSRAIAIAAVRPNGSLLWNFIPMEPSGLDRKREGELLYPLPKKKRSRATRRKEK